MAIADLSTRVTVQDENGGDLYQAWARVEHAEDAEDARFTFRYRGDLVPNMLLKCKQGNFRVVHVPDLTDRRPLYIEVIAVKPRHNDSY